ncbi:MAG: hypothetical protein KAS77_11440, partial [Thermoplasmata archaeon]|nr:hypothetical protein [Thermoplasmata archaeon]
MRNPTATLLLLLLSMAVLLLMASQAGASDNDTPETAAPLDQYNYITEFVNGTNDSMEYWYWMDIDRGDELFIYFTGTGDAVYNRTRMLYYVYGPDSWESSSYVHGESWYRQKQSRNDSTNYWDWICPKGGRYYFYFFAYQQAVGDFRVNIARDSPKELFRFGSDTGTLWWGGVTDQNNNDVWKIWLEATDQELEGVRVTVNWTNDRRFRLYAYDLVDSFEQNALNVSYWYPGDTAEVIMFTPSYTGWYYIRVEYHSWTTQEVYTIRTREYSAPNDGDNDPANATHVLKTASYNGRIEASRDMHDWFKADLVEGDLLGISMQIMDPYNPDYNPDNPNLQNFFEIQVYDPNMHRVRNGYDLNGGWPVPDTYINDLPIQSTDIRVNGTYYIRASFSWSYGAYNDLVNPYGHVIAFCDYVVQITIPNRAPRINQTVLEEVIMLEDTTWWETLAGRNVSSLDLNTVFQDPEHGVMTFKVRGTPNITATLTGDALGLRPIKDWHGEADIRLTADDDSGNTAVAWLHVFVAPVNDPPGFMGMTFTFLEDDPSEENRTFNMYDLFYDVDEDDADSLTFSFGASGPISVSIDQVTGNAVFTVEEDLNGEFFLTFTATDLSGSHTSGEARLNIIPVNDAPKGVDEDAVHTFPEGFALETFDAADHMYDPDGDKGLLWFVTYVDPADEALLIVTNEGRETQNSAMVVTSATGKQDWYGSVTVIIACVDPGGLRGEKEFTITITNRPDPPEIADWTPRTNPEFGEGETFSFSVDNVRDPDGEDAQIHFSFRVKGPDDIFAREVQNTTSRVFAMETDFESEGEYLVSVVIFDEDLMSSVNPLDWIVTVTKTNRVPLVTIDAPGEGDAFKEGKWVEFQATPTDPDAEDQAGLVVEWYEGDTRLG